MPQERRPAGSIVSGELPRGFPVATLLITTRLPVFQPFYTRVRSKVRALLA